ncbi:hypothetical protein, partial [Streptomyces sp. NPDC051662]|uniref:hypothetical protein n=1 Tax=Streptomyces sp. NPDC051662 TaxID=3154750 RepID=UPI0034438251
KAMAWDLRSNMQDEIDRSLLTSRLSDQQIDDFMLDGGGGNGVALPWQISATPLTRKNARRPRPGVRRVRAGGASGLLLLV